MKLQHIGLWEHFFFPIDIGEHYVLRVFHNGYNTLQQPERHLDKFSQLQIELLELSMCRILHGH